MAFIPTPILVFAVVLLTSAFIAVASFSPKFKNKFIAKFQSIFSTNNRNTLSTTTGFNLPNPTTFPIPTLSETPQLQKLKSGLASIPNNVTAFTQKTTIPVQQLKSTFGTASSSISALATAATASISSFPRQFEQKLTTNDGKSVSVLSARSSGSIAAVEDDVNTGKSEETEGMKLDVIEETKKSDKLWKEWDEKSLSEVEKLLKEHVIERNIGNASFNEQNWYSDLTGIERAALLKKSIVEERKRWEIEQEAEKKRMEMEDRLPTPSEALTEYVRENAEVLKIQMEVSMPFLKWAESWNGKLAFGALVVIFLRELFEPTHPTVVEQTMQLVHLPEYYYNLFLTLQENAAASS
eukprot:CAMPEP_0182446038 /NCGR_PEP_ID=MMETSP1172-20130603/3943_1 /TAXON_ID=708627 /ORGANISM="Timspurckia oligopyrenoides, Strain CCMP3278" /LENGTH=352 /DNA_ID=CAMNT_0024641899 /DNA_START=270 /DNA_END=1328 /DNA_ORIENTATION=+